MPLNATFVADFSSFLDATAKAVEATERFQNVAAQTGPAVDIAARQAAAAQETAAVEADKVLENAREFGHKLGDSLKEVASATTEFVNHYAEAFGEAERLTVRLGVALKNAGAPPETVHSYEELAKHLAAVSTFSVGAITNTQILLTEIGNVKPENMEAALTATMDLARAIGVDLPAATKLMARAASLDGASVGRLKQLLGDAYEKGMDFSQIMEAVEKKFGGQSAADLNTYAGRLEHLKNEFEETRVKIGGLIAPTLEKLLATFDKLPDSTKAVTVGLIDIVDNGGEAVQSIAALVELLSTDLAATVGAGILAGFEALMAAIGPVGWVILGLTAVGVAIWAWRDDITAAMKDTWEKEKEYAQKWVDALTPMVEAVAKMYYGVKDWLSDKLGALFDSVADKVKNFTDKTVEWFRAMYMKLVGGSIVPDLIYGLGSEFGKLDSVMVDPVKAATDSVRNMFNSIAIPGATGIAWPGATGMSQAVASQFVKFPLVFGGSTSGLTETPLGSVITINMSGMLSTDDPQTRAQLRDVISDALMPGMKSSRLLGST